MTPTLATALVALFAAVLAILAYAARHWKG